MCITSVKHPTNLSPIGDRIIDRMRNNHRLAQNGDRFHQSVGSLSIDDLIVFLKHFHRNLLEDPSPPPEQIPDDLPEGLTKIYRELGGLIALLETTIYQIHRSIEPKIS